MKRQGLIFQLDASDVESAVMQFVCACHPDVAAGYTISVYNQSSCTAIAFDGNAGCGILEPEDVSQNTNEVGEQQATGKVSQ